MASGKIRIGILGAGAMGAEHAAAYADIPDDEIVGVFARDLERARGVSGVTINDGFGLVITARRRQ